MSHFSVIGAVIPIGTPDIKRKIYERVCCHRNLVFPNIISPSARLMDPVTIKMGMGNIICSGSILTTEICMGDFNLINLSATVGHNVKMGSYIVVNPLVSVSGGVEVEDGVLLGAGSAIKQGVKVMENSIVGLGAIIPKDVEKDRVMICQGAYEMK